MQGLPAGGACKQGPPPCIGGAARVHCLAASDTRLDPLDAEARRKRQQLDAAAVAAARGHHLRQRVAHPRARPRAHQHALRHPVRQAAPGMAQRWRRSPARRPRAALPLTGAAGPWHTHTEYLLAIFALLSIMYRKDTTPFSAKLPPAGAAALCRQQALKSSAHRRRRSLAPVEYLMGSVFNTCARVCCVLKTRPPLPVAVTSLQHLFIYTIRHPLKPLCVQR